MNKSIYLPGVFWKVDDCFYTVVRDENGYKATVLCPPIHGEEGYEPHDTITVGTVAGAHQAAERMIAVL